jgi:hypothetical protein
VDFVDGKQLCKRKRWLIGRYTAKAKPGKRCTVGYHMCAVRRVATRTIRAMKSDSPSIVADFQFFKFLLFLVIRVSEPRFTSKYEV